MIPRTDPAFVRALPGRQATVAILVAGAAGFVSILVAAQPIAAGVLLLGGGVVVGASTRKTWWIGLAGSAIGAAIGGRLNPGVLAGQDTSAPALLVAGFLVSLFVFIPGWFFGTAIRAGREPDDELPKSPTRYALSGLVLLAVPATLLVLYLVILLTGGACCP